MRTSSISWYGVINLRLCRGWGCNEKRNKCLPLKALCPKFSNQHWIYLEAKPSASFSFNSYNKKHRHLFEICTQTSNRRKQRMLLWMLVTFFFLTRTLFRENIFSLTSFITVSVQQRHSHTETRPGFIEHRWQGLRRWCHPGEWANKTGISKFLKREKKKKTLRGGTSCDRH